MNPRSMDPHGPPGPHPPDDEQAAQHRPPRRHRRADAQPLFVPLLRSPPASQIVAVPQHSDDPTSAMSVSSEQLGRVGLALGRLGGLLPGDVLTAEDRPTRAKALWDGQDALLHRIARAQRLTGLAPRVAGAAPAQLDELIERKGLYLSIRRLGDRVRNCAMDLRLIYGSFQYDLIDRVMTHLGKRLADPQLTHREMESLLGDFGPALIKLDRIMRQGPERKHELDLLRERASAAAQDARDEADMQEVIYQMNSGQNPERAALLKAARRYFSGAADARGENGADASTALAAFAGHAPKGPTAPSAERRVIR